MRTNHSEIDQDDHHGNGHPIAEDDEGPRITGITCEDQTADRTAFKMGPPGKQRPFAAVRAALAQPAPKRRADQFRAGRRHTQKSVQARTDPYFSVPVPLTTESHLLPRVDLRAMCLMRLPQASSKRAAVGILAGSRPLRTAPMMVGESPEEWYRYGGMTKGVPWKTWTLAASPRDSRQGEDAHMVTVLV
jgi:hypothetical protein